MSVEEGVLDHDDPDEELRDGVGLEEVEDSLDGAAEDALDDAVGVGGDQIHEDADHVAGDHVVAGAVEVAHESAGDAGGLLLGIFEEQGLADLRGGGGEEFSGDHGDLE